MEVYRLSREKYASHLSGAGAAIKGARWNSPGIELIYTAQNRSLAMAEVAVHFTLATLPGDYVMVTIHIPDTIATKEINEKDLPADWRAFPHPASTQKFGDKLVMENQYCVFIVPSVVTKGDFNVIINPNHKDFSQIRIDGIEKFPFDKRIFR